MAQKNRREIRAAIVTAAAARCGCTVKDIYIRARKGLLDVVVNLKKIPEYVIRYARRVLRQRFTEHVTKKLRQQYFRGAPFMRAC